jgi:cell division inhibitor SepF
VFRIRPKHFSEASILADQFRKGVPVSMDLTLTSIKQRQRFIDFAAGLVYALDGHLARTSNQVYVLTPRS